MTTMPPVIVITEPPNSVIPLTEHLITRGLGYCCLWAFFSLFRRTGLIALRLGVTPRTVRLYKARFRNGEFQCAGNCSRCMKDAVKAAREL